MAAKVEEPELWNLNKNYFWLKFTKQTITQHYIMLCDGLFKKKKLSANQRLKISAGCVVFIGHKGAVLHFYN